LNTRQKEYLTAVLNSGRHLLQLINDVLDLSKIEAGRMELRPEPCDVRVAVSEVCAVMAPVASGRGIVIDPQVSDLDEPLMLDSQRFRQVLYNLVSNAVKFSHDDGVVQIHATLDGAGLRVQVSDQGIGIKPGDMGKLFVEFQQIETGAARHYEGTGLGLALTRRIIELQGGSIDVDSMPGLGSTFTVLLPAVTGGTGA
ncbi:MAG: sensor histidine kinase, partial [Planctomycetota bacterium]